MGMKLGNVCNERYEGGDIMRAMKMLFSITASAMLERI